MSNEFGLDCCPYRESICSKCPGDSEGEELWIPMKGFKAIPEGLFCIDWEVIIHIEKITEGTHQSNTDSADKIDNAMAKYLKSPKGKVAQRKHLDSEKGQATVKRYEDSEKFKLAVQKYRNSEKGILREKEVAAAKKLERHLVKWITKHPGEDISIFYKDVCFCQKYVTIEEAQNICQCDCESPILIENQECEHGKCFGSICKICSRFKTIGVK